MSPKIRDSLQKAQVYWHHPATVAMFERYGLKQEVLSTYKQARKRGNEPADALEIALFEWDL